jgi:hypothetical protein
VSALSGVSARPGRSIANRSLSRFLPRGWKRTHALGLLPIRRESRGWLSTEFPHVRIGVQRMLGTRTGAYAIPDVGRRSITGNKTARLHLHHVLHEQWVDSGFSSVRDSLLERHIRYCIAPTRTAPIPSSPTTTESRVLHLLSKNSVYGQAFSTSNQTIRYTHAPSLPCHS